MVSAVEQIKERLSIIDVLGSYITLIPAGKQYKAKCPFHNERTASFSVSPDRGLYYCFGCGAKGDMFTFVEQFEGLDFNGTLKVLAERAGVELRRDDRKRDDLSPIYEFLEKTTIRYQTELQKNNEALLYLKGRGLTKESIEQFRIGYAPVEWRFVAQSCSDDGMRRIAERAGLIKKKEEGSGDYYDRFRGRIMFPLTDTSGRVVGFSGRIFPETPEGPKYLNSPETEVFQKSRILYGFDKAKFHIKRLGFSVLVEGQMDLIMSHQNGFRNTVATSGTAVSEQSAEDEHAHLIALSRLSPHLFLAFDGDSAGQKALGRAALVALSLGMNPKVVPLPEGVDPAEYLERNGQEGWKQCLKESQHFIVHQVRAIKQGNHSPHMLVRAIREHVFPYLSKVLSPVEQHLYIDTVAKELSLSSTDVARELAQFVARLPQSTYQKEERATQLNTNTTETLSLRERLAAFVERFPESLPDNEVEKLTTLTFNDTVFGPLALAQEKKAAALALIERDYGAINENERSAIAKELVVKAKDDFFIGIRATLTAAIREAEAKGDEQRVMELLGALAALNTAMRNEGAR